MLCDFGDNSPRVLDSPISVTCLVCNQSYKVRVFPLYAECVGNADVEELLQCVRANRIAETIAAGETPSDAILTAFAEHEGQRRESTTGMQTERIEPFSGEKFANIGSNTEERIGLGDVVAGIIKAATFGLASETPGCGCAQRREWLNNLMSWRRNRQ